MMVCLSSTPFVAAESENESDQMIRIIMLPPEAEATGMYVDENGRFFVNAMHPDSDNYQATVGVINGVDWNNLPDEVPELHSSSSASDIWHGIRTGYGDYQVILQAGDATTDGRIAGGIYSAHNGQQILLSQKPDYNAFIPTTLDGNKGYLYTAWEDRPAGISQVEIEWNPTSNEWDVLSKQMLNLSDINGAWVLCFGSVSPWSSPLFSEELYFDDTEDWNNDGYRYHSDQLRLEQYLGHYPNPYDYGYIIEMEDASTATPEMVRHLTMGRFSHENAFVMPDNKTVYLTDDGYDTVLFKFIADTAGDLTGGTLYAAKLTQDATWDSAIAGFGVEWLELGSSSNSEIQRYIDDYDGITTADYVQGENSYISDEEINDWAEGYLNQDLNNDGIVGYALDDRVAFLETRKAAAAIGATDEWNKMEGVGFNPNAPEKMYLAMSSIDNAMTDGQGDIDVSDNLCGIVYQMTMVDSWDVNRIDPAIIGGPYSSSNQNQCNIDNLAGPDNLVVLDDGSVLVGEDTRRHESNMVWLWREYIPPMIEVDEEIQLNYFMPTSTPADLESPWTYEYQAEVSDLAQDTTYTAIVVAKNLTSGEWSGIWWWEDIQSSGDQYDLMLSLNRGCYSIDSTLYEEGDLNADPGSATVLSSNQSEVVVGDGTCLDGVYTEAIEPVPSEENQTDEKTNSTPGFGYLSAIVSISISMIIVRRKNESTGN